MWFLIAFLGYALLAIVLVLDKLILTESVDAPEIFTFWSTLFPGMLLFAIPFGVEMLVGIHWVWAIASGLGFGLGLWTLYIAVQKGEASHVNPFVGATITVSTYLMSSFFLGEQLTNVQLLGMVLLVGASLLLSVHKCMGRYQFHAGFAWAIVAGIAFAISHTAAKYLYDIYPFFTGFVWTRGFIGLVALSLLFSGTVRNSFKNWWKNQKSKKLKRKKTKPKHSTGVLILSNKVLGVIGVVLVQYAISIGSVTMVNAMQGLEYAILFVLIYLLTKLAPHIFKETFTRRELVVEILAIALIVVGSALFVM